MIIREIYKRLTNYCNILISNISLKKARIQTQKAIEDTLKSNQDLIKTQEELTVALEKAKEADYLKFTFLNSMQYEIRTPLNTKIGRASCRERV